MFHVFAAQILTTVLTSTRLSTVVSGGEPVCKSTPRSASWPPTSRWDALNTTLHGRLLSPLPPAAVCHASQPIFDAKACKATNWTQSTVYVDSPLGVINPNWSNDSCLPQPQYSCTGDGFPIYVVDASNAAHVAAGVDFARGHDIRLNVKGSGHDYLGRSVAANSLSIWTKHIRGVQFHSSFTPVNCSSCEPFSAATLGAGEDWGELYSAAHARNLTFVGGTGDTIGLGGYLTGGGHSPLSAMLGLAVDQVLEMEVVVASGEIVITNQAKNADLFWTMRGGGGATFGIMTSVTLRTFRDMPVASLTVLAGAAPESEAFWNLPTFIVSASPRLQESGVMGYCYISPSTPYGGAIVGGYTGVFVMPNGTLKALHDATLFLQKYVASIEGAESSFIPTHYPSLYAYYEALKNTNPVGSNIATGNRLLDSKALSNVSKLGAAMHKATPKNTIANLNLVAGPGMWKAKPAGGSTSVLPAWKNDVFVEYAIGVTWPFLDTAAEKKQRNLLTNVYMEVLRELAPDTGSYLNEGDVNEPDFQQAFWGSNYARLLDIKKRVDPDEVFWCAVCVGSEGWHETKDGVLCRLGGMDAGKTMEAGKTMASQPNKAGIRTPNLAAVLSVALGVVSACYVAY